MNVEIANQSELPLEIPAHEAESGPILAPLQIERLKAYVIAHRIEPAESEKARYYDWAENHSDLDQRYNTGKIEELNDTLSHYRAMLRNIEDGNFEGLPSLLLDDLVQATYQNMQAKKRIVEYAPVDPFDTSYSAYVKMDRRKHLEDFYADMFESSLRQQAESRRTIIQLTDFMKAIGASIPEQEELEAMAERRFWEDQDPIRILQFGLKSLYRAVRSHLKK